jgi:DNA-binding MarR family transcriptional regulator
MITGKIDSSFQTEQRDLFASGVVAEIGVNAYAVWSAIKYHADFQTGEAWPGMRRLGELVGLSKSAVDRAVDVLEAAHMLRVTAKPKGRGQIYIARERMAVRIGDRIICTIVMDYVPSKMRGKLLALEKELDSPGSTPEAFANVEIIPGDGFVWDEGKKSLVGRLNASEIPKPQSDPNAEHFSLIGAALLRKVLPQK